MAWILQSGMGDQRLESRGFRDGDGRGKHKNAGRHCGPVGVVAARHTALRHAGHFVTAVHGFFRTSEPPRLVMSVDWALGL